MATQKTEAQATESTDIVEPEAPEQATDSIPTAVKEVPKEELDAILRHHVYAAMGIGLIPIPIIDLAALTGVQLNLLRKLAKLYDVPFSKDLVKKILSSLVGGTLPVVVAPGIALSIAKFIPLFGYTAAAMTLPIMGGAATYAVGKVFIRHFESGGTFLSFDSEKMKAYYMQMFEEGKHMADKLKQDKKPQASE